MNDLERVNFNPIDKLVKCFEELETLKAEALGAYKSMRGYGSDGRDSGTQYLANAIKCVTDQASIANNLAKFRYPTLSAMAIKSLDGEHDKQPMTTAEAITIIKNDPFSPKEIKEIPTERIIESMNSNITKPSLPFGNTEHK